MTDRAPARQKDHAEKTAEIISTVADRASDHGAQTIGDDLQARRLGARTAITVGVRIRTAEMTRGRTMRIEADDAQDLLTREIGITVEEIEKG